jgi:hypothetical protein
MLAKIAFNTLGVLIFLFVFWKRLREDYPISQIFTTGLYMIAGISLAVIISAKFFGSWGFWLSFIGAALGLALGVLKFKLRFFETFEAGVTATLPWLGVVFLSDSIEKSNISSFIGFIVIILLIVLFYFLDAHYKKFTWYKSGRVGFTGLTTLGLLLLLRAAVAPIVPDMLSFSGKYEAIISGILAFVSFLLVFNLARTQS